MVRQFMRQPGQLGGIIVMLVTLGPLVLILAGMSAFVYLTAPGIWPVNVLALVLVGLWLVWIVLPLLAFRMNEGLDMERLLIYPLRSRELVASALLGTLIDWPTYFTLPFFLAILIGWFTSPAFWVVLLAAVLGYLHMMAASQLALTASTGLLRSRRFRDIAIVVASLAGSSCYFVTQGLQAAARSLGVETLQSVRPMFFLQWLPPGAGARSVELVLAGDWPQALLWLLYSLAWLAACVWAWWSLLQRVTTGVTIWQPRAAPATRKVRLASTRPSSSESLLRWLDPCTRQMFIKELRAMWRIPQRRIGALQSIISPLVLLFFFGMNGRAGGSVPSTWVSLMLPGLALFSAWSGSMNMLGMEGRGLPTLLLSPVPRRHLFTGKGLAIWLVTVTPLTILAGAFTLVARNPSAIVSWLAMLGVALAGIAVNIVAAVYLAWPFDEESTRRQNTGGGCASALGQVVLVPLAMLVAGAPILLPLSLGAFLNLQWLQTGAALASLPYGIILFVFAATQAGQLLPAREAEIIEATRWPSPR